MRHPASHQPDQQVGGERPAGAGHLGAAGLGRVDRLVVGQVVGRVEVAVLDRAPVPGQERRPRRARRTARPATAGTTSARARGSRRAAAAGRHPAGAAGRRPAARGPGRPRRAVAARPPRCRRPASVETCTRRRRTLAATRRQRRRHRGGGVHDQQVAGLQEVRQVAEQPVPQRVRARVQQPHAVAGQAAALGRARRVAARAGVEPGVRERDRGRTRAWRSCADLLPAAGGERGQVGRAVAPAGPARGDQAAPASARRVLGSGRSLMSSPGKASWCIRVRRSPGSTAYTVRSGRSTASTRATWSSAALDAPYPPQPS